MSHVKAAGSVLTVTILPASAYSLPTDQSGSTNKVVCDALFT